MATGRSCFRTEGESGYSFKIGRASRRTLTLRASHLRDPMISVPRILALSALTLAGGLLASCKAPLEPQQYTIFDLGKVNATLDHGHSSGHGQDLVKPLRLISAEKPVYPAEMQNSGKAGEVQVAFVVNEKGRVESSRVVKSTDRRLNDPALQSLLKWKFEPPVGKSGPRKVNATQRIVFAPEKGDRGFSQAARQLGHTIMPFHYPKFRYQKLWADKPAYLALLEPRPLVKIPQPVDTSGLDFPASLFTQGGKAALDASFVIAEDGSIEAVRIVESTNPNMNRLVETAVRHWKYEPAQTAKGPVKSLWEKRFVFASGH